jgi:Secretion system C-terminal sorting domain
MRIIKKSALIIVAGLLYYNLTDAQKTPPVLAPGVTAPIGQNTNNGTGRLIPCDYADVRVFPSPNPQSEVHISINKTNPNVMLLSSNTFPNAFSGVGAWWTTNGGTTWTGNDHMPNNAQGRADPSTAFDATGNGYIAVLSSPGGNPLADPNGYAIQRTTNNGAIWQPQALGVTNIDCDKEMVAADDVPTSPFANNFYAAWTNFGISGGAIQINRSTNGGAAFSAPITLNNHWGQGANVQTGPNGEVYVCWADYTNGNLPEKGLGFTSSTNGGVTFATATIPFTYTGIRVGNFGNSNFGGTRVNSFPSMTVDKSTGIRRGRIYVVYAENINGTSVIRLRFSDNQGVNWSTANTISISNGRQSWFPWISCDANDGNIYVTYYSLDQPSGFQTNTYVASSKDGGTTFVNQIVSDVNHITHAIPEFSGGYAGDYIGITAHGGNAYAAWMDNRTGQWQNYVSRTRVADIDLNGSTLVCAPNTYTVTGVPAGATINWQLNPFGIATLTSNGNSATVTRNGDAVGSVTLSAEVAQGGCSFIVSIGISVGPPPNNIQLAGNSPLCGTENYLIANPPINPVITWQPFTPGGLVNMTTSGNVATLTQISNGTGTLSAQVNDASGCYYGTFSKQIIVGLQSPANIVGLNPPIGVSPGELLELEADNSSMLSYNWSVEGGVILGNANHQFHVLIQVDQCLTNISNGYINVHLSYDNACGTGDTYTEWTTIDCGTGGGGPLRAIPNPATGNTSIDIQGSGKVIKEIKITDKMGNVIKQIRFSGINKREIIDVSTLPSDIYYVQVFDGKTWIGVHLSVRH